MYDPGDVVNGHVLTGEGQWIPVAPPPQPQQVINVNTQRPRSRGLAILLAILLGPLGLIYWDARMGSILTVVTVVTLGFAVIVTYPWAVIQACVAKQG